MEKLLDPPSNIELVPEHKPAQLLLSEGESYEQLESPATSSEGEIIKTASYLKGSQKNISSILIHTTPTP